MTNKNEENNERKDDEGGSLIPGGKKFKFNFNFYWIYGLIAVVIFGLQILSWGSGVTQTTWAAFERDMLSAGDVDRIVIVNKDMVEIYIIRDKLTSEKYKEIRNQTFGNAINPGPHYVFEISSVDYFLNYQLKEAQEKYGESHRKIHAESESRKNWGGEILGWLFPILLMVGLWVFIMRRMSSAGGGAGGGIFSIGKSKAELFDANNNVKISFKDVAGLEEAKEEIIEVVEFLQHPAKFTKLGAKIPKGVLLVGPPGTGKTLLAKAVAGEAGVPFFSLSGSDFVEMFVGVGAARVRDLFNQAKTKAPCIIFIDEIDAIGRSRGKGQFSGANDERENTLNSLLSEMDGFSTNSGVIILAATNRPEILDSALMRPGRFDRQIGIDKPDLVGREGIFDVHLKPLKLKKDVSSALLAAQTPGFAGADIANVCNEAALIAARSGKKGVDMKDFEAAIDRVIGGLERKTKIISPEEKEIVAYHEAGHAVAGWFLEFADPLVKVTIVPRGLAALGYAQYLPKEQYLYRTEKLLDEICMSLGGRAAEEIIFGKISTGALSDLERITKVAYNMITMYGMNDKIGNISFYDPQQAEYTFSKPYSESTAQTIDIEVRKLIDTAYERTKKLLKDKRKELEIIAKELLLKEVIFETDITRLIGKSPFASKRVLETAKSIAKKAAKSSNGISKKTAKKTKASAKGGSASGGKKSGKDS